MRRLSGGAMGEVYLARDVRLGRNVAIKALTAAHLGSEAARERFWAEARTTARLRHPNIVVIHGAGEHEGCPYLALEYVEGQTLRERISREPISPSEILRFGVAIAEALEEAHAHRIVHRDLKPENIIVPTDGRLRVVDFGVALSSATAHEGRRVCGTPPYMAPEQWLGMEVDAACDVWAVGVILYEILTGRRPFEGETDAELKLRVCSPASAPAPFPDVDGPLNRLIEDCLEKRPHRRPSAQQLVARLRDLLDDQRISRDDGPRVVHGPHQSAAVVCTMVTKTGPAHEGPGALGIEAAREGLERPGEIEDLVQRAALRGRAPQSATRCDTEGR